MCSLLASCIQSVRLWSYAQTHMPPTSTPNLHMQPIQMPATDCLYMASGLRGAAGELDAYLQASMQGQHAHIYLAVRNEGSIYHTPSAMNGKTENCETKR